MKKMICGVGLLKGFKNNLKPERRCPSLNEFSNLEYIKHFLFNNRYLLSVNIINIVIFSNSVTLLKKYIFQITMLFQQNTLKTQS